MATRRQILTTGAASIVVIGAGTLAFNALHSDLRIAREPWKTAGGDFGDPRLNALAYAILAPNPHNRQPWVIDLQNDNALTIYCDLDRLLPETDPLNRQITIGLGAFLELLRQAAAEQGYALQVEQFPAGEPQPVLDGRPIANVAFVKDLSVKPDPLFAFALDRRTVRAPFDQKKPVDEAAFTELAAVLRESDGDFFWTNDAANITALKDICKRGWLIEVGTEKTHHESTTLTRIGEQEINANPDGISLSGPVMEGARLAGVITAEKMDDTSSRAYQETINFYNGLIDTAMGFGWLTTMGNNRKDQLNAGAGWMRIHLAATRIGLAMHPLSQALQEFPEMAAPYKEIHDFAGGDTGATVQGLFRFGYAKFPAPAPRWPLTSRLVNAS